MEFGKSRTQQNFKRQVNINSIVEKARVNGMLPNNGRIPQYLDVSEVKDYQEYQNRVIAVNTAFAALPSKVREKFRNDPAEMVDFINKPENIDEAEKLGLLKRTPIKQDDEGSEKKAEVKKTVKKQSSETKADE